MSLLRTPYEYPLEPPSYYGFLSDFNDKPLRITTEDGEELGKML